MNRLSNQHSRVKFADSHQVLKVVPRISSFSEEELAQIWFEREEFQDFADDIRRTIARMERGGKAPRGKKHTYTGLESFTKEGRALKTALRENAYDAIMFLQEDQYQQMGRRDSVVLAQAYHEVSQEAKRLAFLQALRLHEDVAV